MKRKMKHLSLLLCTACLFPLTSFSQFTFSVNSSSGGFTITCGVPSLTLNAFSSSSSASYTWITPQLLQVNAASVSATTAGVYTVSATSGTSAATKTISIGSNTIPPPLGVTIPTNILSCAMPSVQLQASSGTPGATFLWMIPFSSPTYTGSTITATITPSVTPNNTLVGNYTVTVTDPVNLCKTSSIIPLYRNTYLPTVLITKDKPGLNCKSPYVLLTNFSQTGIPPNSAFPRNQPVVVQTWEPDPFSFNTANTHSAFIPGSHTLTVIDQNNGCSATGTIAVSDDRFYPMLNTSPVYSVDCPTGSVIITPSVTAPTTSLSYKWESPWGGVVNTASCMVNSNSPGVYTLTVSNLLNGCATSTLVYIWACVGLQEEKWSSRCSFPNPVNDVLTLLDPVPAIQYVNVEIYDLQGRCVLKCQPADTGEVNVAGLTPGAYILRTSAGGGNHQEIFIKQ
jgi:hypothetical protein